MSRCHWMVLALLGPLPALGNNEGKKSPAATEVEARFHDGTTIRKVLLFESVELATKYGKLTVPVGDIRRIEFGFRQTEEIAQKVAEAMGNLGSAKLTQREAAGKELVALGYQAYPALRKAAQSKDKEVAQGATAALERIRALVGEDRLHVQTNDVIHTGVVAPAS